MRSGMPPGGSCVGKGQHPTSRDRRQTAQSGVFVMAVKVGGESGGSGLTSDQSCSRTNSRRVDGVERGFFCFKLFCIAVDEA